MNNFEKKEYLKKYIPAISQLETIQTRREKACNISGQKLTDMPTSHGAVGDKMAETICELVSMEDKFFEKELQKYQDIIGNVLTAIYALENMIEKQIMTLKYIHGMDWKDVNVKMGYEERQIRRYHSMALQNIEINITTCSVA